MNPEKDDVNENDIKGNCIVEFLCLIKQKQDVVWWKKFVEFLKRMWK